MKAVYINRSDIGWYSRNANVYRKAMEVVTKYEATLCLCRECSVPPEIECKARRIVRFDSVLELLRNEAVDLIGPDEVSIFTGFDFPCMRVALALKNKYNCHWTVFCWDPPSLNHRDRFPPLRWAIDYAFRHYVSRCDHLVLNIHPGLLNEIGFSSDEIKQWKTSGKLELRMQDAFDDLTLPPIQSCDEGDYEYDIGVLSNWSSAKGGLLLKEAMNVMPGKKCLWIGDRPSGSIECPQIIFTGRLEQHEAFDRLGRCRLLLAPYLPVKSLKWNYVLKLFEYLQIGCRILASDNPGNVAVAERFPGRIELFRSGDVDDLVRKISKMI